MLCYLWIQNLCKAFSIDCCAGLSVMVTVAPGPGPSRKARPGRGPQEAAKSRHTAFKSDTSTQAANLTRNSSWNFKLRACAEHVTAGRSVVTLAACQLASGLASASSQNSKFCPKILPRCCCSANRRHFLCSGVGRSGTQLKLLGLRIWDKTFPSSCQFLRWFVV